ncbi:MAG TPA: hypothetical protein VE093_07305 [Polyangiaceae bacterium]|nr:hypothetical protein [Polyangiaceae bacterium]
MVIAVACVYMVKMTGYEIVDVVTVRDRGMAAIHAVHVLGTVLATRVIGRAPGGVRRIDGNRALVDVIVVDLVEVAIVQVVDMAGVANSRVTTGGSMDVIVAGMSGVRHMSSVG